MSVNDEGSVGSTLYPITLNKMDTKTVVVFGGGPVGERKVRGLLDASATVLLISPEATDGLRQLAQAGRIQWRQRTFRVGDTAEGDLVFAATNQREVNRAIADEARSQRILCNVADNPAEGDFHSMAVLRTDGLIVGVNNERRQPKRAVAVRERIRRLLAG